MNLTDAIDNLKHEMRNNGIRPENGLGTELFLFSSSLAPVVNVDLLIFNSKGQVLLSWRDDPYSGTGWHIPGSCIRFWEAIEESIVRCAGEEIGTERIEHTSGPIKVYEFIIKENRAVIRDQRERAHFITLVYRCALPDGFRIDDHNSGGMNVGSLSWFDDLPENLLPLQECYRKDWEQLKTGGIQNA